MGPRPNQSLLVAARSGAFHVKVTFRLPTAALDQQRGELAGLRGEAEADLDRGFLRFSRIGSRRSLRHDRLIAFRRVEGQDRPVIVDHGRPAAAHFDQNFGVAHPDELS